MGGFILLVSLALFFLCIVLTIFPQPKFIIKTRKQSSFGVFASFLLFAVGAALLPPVAPSADEKNTQQLAASISSSSSQAAKAEFSQELINNQARNYVQEIIDRAANCDAYGTKIALAAENNDAVAMYEAAQSGQPACYDAAQRLKNLKPPVYVSADGAKQLQEAVNKMGDAYYEKAYSFTLFKKIADGDTRASVISEAKQSGERIQAATIMGFALVNSVLHQEGAAPDAIMPKGSEK
ncbi:hypothetical protein PQU92_08195 [Asticcacaulis sp. BYS171W]|uniref:DUF4142 domain-containing protein n=1 Tax=Asticcacaulis aquaticus TaxID=2984212 RepID=A0ABT5HT85_9CAUL|nr:hypothetical protein [Asticcacaulis aquaticus]MDC7683254.1 hypothetical protein [Asticcacaulis aquaticus]